jgi:hypothetical protein
MMKGWAVLHENDIGRGPEYGVASSVHLERERAENALGYCLAMQEAGRPGTEGRYFIVQVVEV